MAVGIITGTAIYKISSIKMSELMIKTPYGEALVFQGKGKDEDLFFLPRHGPQHTTPPHKVNYRANIKALQMLGVKKVLAAYAVGSINLNLPPLSLVAIDDFLDFTSGRDSTFFDGGDSKVKHVEMSSPYCSTLREILLAFSSKHGLQIHPKGTYACTNGPRLETPAEIRMLSKLGADVVGMTGFPEVVLAKELDICFAAVAFSINWAAGIEKEIRFYENGLSELKEKLPALFIDTLREASKKEVC